MKMLSQLLPSRAKREAFLRQRTEHEDLAGALLTSEPHTASVEDAISECPGGWAIDARVGRIIANAVVRLDKTSVLEFGAGSSSVLAATALAAGGEGRLTSVEQDPTWCEDAWKQVGNFSTVDAQMVASTPEWKIGRLGVYAYHAEASRTVATRGPYDLVVVDAPQFFFGREGALSLARNQLSPGALVILDDANRSGERWALFKWLNTYPGLRLLCLDETNGGVALLAVEDKRVSFSLPSFLKGCHHGLNRIRTL